MAHGGSQLDYHVLQDLKQRFPEIPEGVVSQYLLQVHAYTRMYTNFFYAPIPLTFSWNVLHICTSTYLALSVMIH